MRQLGGKMRVADMVCPYCNHEVNGVSRIGDETTVPREGNVAICIRCCNPAVFTSTGLRMATSAELMEFDKDEELLESIRVCKASRFLSDLRREFTEK
jgi:C4-type Zn-finger protein